MKNDTKGKEVKTYQLEQLDTGICRVSWTQDDGMKMQLFFRLQDQAADWVRHRLAKDEQPATTPTPVVERTAEFDLK